MPVKPDLVPNQTFSRLTIIKKADRKGKTGKSYYLCQCSCGKTTLASRSDLVTGNVKSCRCLRRELPSTVFKKEKGSVSYTALYNRNIRGAKLRKLTFNVPSEYYKKLICSPCYYCGAEPKPFNAYNLKQQINMTTTAVKEAWIQVNGVDRINPNVGYEVGNIVPCCTKCNYGKMSWSEEEYINHCYEVVKHQESKKKASA